MVNRAQGDVLHATARVRERTDVVGVGPLQGVLGINEGTGESLPHRVHSHHTYVNDSQTQGPVTIVDSDLLLRLCHDVQREGGLARRLGPIDLNDAAARHIIITREATSDALPRES